MRIALDAMGGDFAPGPIVAGAVEAVRADPALTVVLVGDRDRVEAELAKAPDAPADRHAVVAGGFGRLVAQTPDWSAPAPVDGWTARDVVGHLVGWFPGFLASGGVDLPAGPSVDDDPMAAWQHHADAVQGVHPAARREPVSG